jgi:hypothetical protein
MMSEYSWAFVALAFLMGVCIGVIGMGTYGIALCKMLLKVGFPPSDDYDECDDSAITDPAV